MAFSFARLVRAASRIGAAAPVVGPAIDTARLRLAASESRLIETEYPYRPRARPIEDSALGRALDARFLAADADFAALIRGFAAHLGAFLSIPHDETRRDMPFWANDWFPPLDGIALYGLLAARAPRRYIEIGSGISTRFARMAIRDHALPTKIVSIDPAPHTVADPLCDEVVRAPLEEVERSFWDGLDAGDLLFVDNSHRSFPNSDVTVFFTEIMPALPPGLLWGLHDICLPWDYPQDWKDRFYNEQYLLATYLAGGAAPDRVVLPSYWAARQPALHGILAPLWARSDLFAGVSTHGCAFWMERRGT